jgi:hypothetical protein
MTIFCLYSRPNGTTTMAPMALRDSGADPFRTNLPTGAGATLMGGRNERQGEWHTAPKLGVTMILRGHLDIETQRANPSVTQLSTGDILLVFDRTGEGHRSRAHGPDGMTALLLPLAEADVAGLAALFADWPTDLVL